MATADGSARAVQGASLLILLQVASRAATFIANQLLLRFLTAQLLGVATQLEVYYLSVVYFGRESLRVAIQRQGNGAALVATDTKSIKDAGAKLSEAEANARNTQAVVNLGYISIALGLLVDLCFGALYLATMDKAIIAATPNLVLSLYLYALAALVELLSEPAFVVMQVRLQFGVRAMAESVATVARCMLTLGCAIWASRNGVELGVLPFAVGQVGYGVGLLAVYSWKGTQLASKEGFSLCPIRVDLPADIIDAASPERRQTTPFPFERSYFYRPTLQLALSMMAQSIVKHILTQGDTFLVSILSTPAAQGVYALANNYGGLAARLLFQPVEESSRNYFSRLLSRSKKTPEVSHRLSEPNGSTEAAVVEASSSLQSLLKVYALLSLVVLTLGPSAAPLLLHLVAGPKWASSGAGECLAAYMWYIPLLAVNGVAEAFVSSVATEAEVHRQSAWMGVFSLVFASSGYVFLRLLDMGATGLVLANAINMLCRIVWCASFISRYFREAGVAFELGVAWPGPAPFLVAVITSRAVAGIASGTTGMATASARETFLTLTKIAAAALPFLAVLAASERRFLLQSYQSMRGKRK